MLPYVTKAVLRNAHEGGGDQFMVAVFLPGAIATCALGRPSVNCPNKKALLIKHAELMKHAEEER